jgi:hypothetical protein
MATSANNGLQPGDTFNLDDMSPAERDRLLRNQAILDGNGAGEGERLRQEAIKEQQAAAAIKNASEADQNAYRMQSAAILFRIATQWSKMSAGQKLKAASTIAIRSEMMPKGWAKDMALGGDVLSLGLDWDKLSDVQKVAKVGSIVEKVAGGDGSGVGAAYGAYNLATNWNKMSNEDKAVASVAVANAAASLAGYTIPGVNIALAAYEGYQIAKIGKEAYYDNGTTNQKRGYVAGGAVVGPVGLGVTAMVHSFSKSGKGEDQQIRDWVRTDWEGKGLIDKDHNITLADGTVFNVGQDGNSGIHEVRNPEQLTRGKDGSIHSGKATAYNVDYTNDLDYSSGMTGSTLQRLLYGGREKNLEDMAGQLGNAFLSSVGYGKDMTKENFDKVMFNARSAYARMGLTNKQDALMLLKAAAEEGRLSAADQAEALQTLNMMYDKDGYEFGSTLMKSRQPSITAVKNLPERTDTIKGPPGTQPITPETASTLTTPVATTDTNATKTKEEIRLENLKRYSNG